MWKEFDGTEAEAMEDEPTFEEREELRRLITRVQATERRNSIEERYNACREASVGDKITCPSCNKIMVKKSYQHVFCSNKGTDNCKDLYWNYVKPSRQRSQRGIDRLKWRNYINPEKIRKIKWES